MVRLSCVKKKLLVVYEQMSNILFFAQKEIHMNSYLVNKMAAYSQGQK